MLETARNVIKDVENNYILKLEVHPFLVDLCGLSVVSTVQFNTGNETNMAAMLKLELNSFFFLFS